MNNISELNLYNKLNTKINFYNSDSGQFGARAVLLYNEFMKLNHFPKSFSLYDLADFFTTYDYPELENDICIYSLLEYPLRKEKITDREAIYWNWTALYMNIDAYKSSKVGYIADLKVLEISEDTDFFKIGKNIDELFYIKHAIERKKVFSNSVEVIFGGLDVSDSSVFYYIDCEITENGSIRIKKHTSVIKIPLFDKWYHFLHYRKNKYYIIDLKETSVDIVLPYEKFLKFTKNIPELIQYDQDTIEKMIV